VTLTAPVSAVVATPTATDATHVIPYRLGSNENPLGTSPKAQAAIAHAAAGLWQYPPRSDESFRQVVGTHHGLDKDNVAIANSGCDALWLIAQAALAEDSQAIICPPTFPVYALTVQKRGAEIVNVPLDADTFALDVDGVLAAVTPKTKAVYLCNPNNPTGTYFGEDALTRLLTHLPAHIWVIYDEVYYHFVDEASRIDIDDKLDAHPNLVVVHSFSKAYGLAGLRLGYALARADTAARLRAHNLPFHVNTLALLAGEAALADREHIAASVMNNQQEKPKLEQSLHALGIRTWQSHANFVLFACPEGWNAQTLSERMLASGIIVRPAFDLPQHLRVTVGLPELNQAFVSALEDTL
jgi:histidinol-phosphate aminotransferase